MTCAVDGVIRIEGILLHPYPGGVCGEMWTRESRGGQIVELVGHVSALMQTKGQRVPQLSVDSKAPKGCNRSRHHPPFTNSAAKGKSTIW